MWLKPLLYELLNPWPATFQKLPEKRAVHVESIKRKTFGKLFNIHCRWLKPTDNNQFIIAALAAFLYPQLLESAAVLFYKSFWFLASCKTKTPIIEMLKLNINAAIYTS